MCKNCEITSQILESTLEENKLLEIENDELLKANAKLKKTVRTVVNKFRDLKEIDKTHKDYAICKCGHEQINTSTIDQCNKCQEFFKLEYPNRKTNYSEVASKYLEE
jgi:hypothetical protein